MNHILSVRICVLYRCDKAFQCYQLAGCFYHKDVAVYQADVMLGKLNGAVGTYMCCGERVIKFDPAQENKVPT